MMSALFDILEGADNIRDDSRCVKRGDVFVALGGGKFDGVEFISEAISRGAKSVVCEEGAIISEAILSQMESLNVGLVRVEDSRLTLAQLCRRHYDMPQALMGVTGTGGKSSVVDFARQLGEKAGLKCASLGTLGVKSSIYDEVNKAEGANALTSIHNHRGGNALTSTHNYSGGNALTSMPCVALHRELQNLANGGVTHAMLEASSHGLMQKRLHGLRFSVGGFTNLSRDHLDYHETMDDYFRAKLILFEDLLTDDGVIIGNNGDVGYYETLRGIARASGRRFIGYGMRGDDICLRSVVPSAGGMEIEAEIFGKSYSAELSLIGDFQAENVLLAVGLLHGVGIAVDAIWGGVSDLTCVAGRMQLVECDFGGVVVDYAHKPEALRVVLETLRKRVGGRVIVIFGCGGDRDRGKRSQMGEIASQLSDYVIISDDNPRYESSEMIRSEIISGMVGGVDYIEIGDRRSAIEYGLAMLRGSSDSILLVAGKGHETGQIIGDDVYDFDDVEVCTTLLGG